MHRVAVERQFIVTARVILLAGPCKTVHELAIELSTMDFPDGRIDAAAADRETRMAAKGRNIWTSNLATGKVAGQTANGDVRSCFVRD